MIIDTAQTISHQVHANSFNEAVSAIEKNIRATNESRAHIEMKLQMLKALTTFPFGRFLIANKGLNGYWTDYMLCYPMRKEQVSQLELSEMESFILNDAPVIKATQERFQIFLKLNQQSVKNHAKLACLPSGLMGELVYLDYQGVDEISLHGFDIDEASLCSAQRNALNHGLEDRITLTAMNAWAFSDVGQYDLISSNGLNIYEPDDDKILELYQRFKRALKPGGRLVTSFLTPQEEWNNAFIQPQDAEKEKLIFSDILGVKWQIYRSTQHTIELLKAGGFNTFELYPDKANKFPTIVGTLTHASN